MFQLQPLVKYLEHRVAKEISYFLKDKVRSAIKKIFTKGLSLRS